MKVLRVAAILAVFIALAVLSVLHIASLALLLLTVVVLGLVVGSTLLRAPLLALAAVFVMGGLLWLGQKFLDIDMLEYTRQSGHAELVAIALVVSLLLGTVFSRPAN